MNEPQGTTPGTSGQVHKARQVHTEVGDLHSSVDPSDIITDGEPREGTCPNASRRSEGYGDGPALREYKHHNISKASNGALSASKRDSSIAKLSMILRNQTEEWDPVSRMRENRSYGLTRGKRVSVISLCASQSALSSLLYSAINLKLKQI